MAYDLSWVEATSGGAEDGFNVYRMLPSETVFTLVGSTQANVTQFIDPQRILGTCYRVTAFNALGESAPAGACALVPGAVTVLVVR